MTPWPKQSLAEMIAFYGNPDANKDGTADRYWQQVALTQIVPPYQMYFDGQPVRRITVHLKCAESLARILDKIALRFDATERKRYGLDQFGGIFNFRRKRAGSSLSTHAFAAAIDLAAGINAFGRVYGSAPNMMPIEVVGYFEDEGWDWGGLWSKGDAMHFQAAKTGQARTTVPLGGGEYRWARETAAPTPRPAWDRPSSFPTKGDRLQSEVTAQVQRRLRELGYTEVGNVDGYFGDLTENAILIFQKDNDLPRTGEIDDALLVALAKAEPRHLSDEREGADAKEVRQQVPEAKASWWSKVTALWGMLASGAVALGSWIGEQFGEARGIVDQIGGLLGSVPLPVYALLIGCVLAFIWLKSRAAEAGEVEAYREGARR